MGEYYAQPTVPEDDLYEGYNNFSAAPAGPPPGTGMGGGGTSHRLNAPSTCARNSCQSDDWRQRMSPRSPPTFGKTIPAGLSRCHTTCLNSTLPR